MKFENLRIATKLWLAVGLLVAAMTALIVFAAVRANQSQTYADQVLTLTETKMRLATRWSQMTEAAVQRAMVNAVNTDAAIGKMLEEANNEAIAKITELHKQLKTLPLSDDRDRADAEDRHAAAGGAGHRGRGHEAEGLAGDLEGARTEATQKFAPTVTPYLARAGRVREAAGRRLGRRTGADRRDRSLTVTIAPSWSC